LKQVSTMNLVVDIGNTLTKLAWFDKGEMIESLRFAREEPVNLNEILRRKPAEMAIVSSVGTNNQALCSDLEKNLKKLICLDHTTPLPIRIGYRSPETLGHDRIAACAGAHCLFPGSNVLVIDMGTTITFDFINAAGEFPGGNISPGLNTRFRALNKYTAKLPLIECDSAFPGFGTDTRTAIVAGVQQGIVFELNGYMNDYAAGYPDCKFILTGGDARFFVSEIKRTIFALPELVMTGLNFILEYNASGGN
jgi:type III pantothenate kinase